MSNKTNLGLTVAIALLAGGALGTGYWLGNRQAATQAASIASPPATAAAPQPPRKPLYYRNPMGLPDTSPVPKKDEMGMDYTPVYEEEAASPTDAQQISFSTEKVQKLGVKTEQVQMRRLDRVVRAVGRVEIDERRNYTIAPKFEGWIERLHVNAAGQTVSKGQALLEVYSPDLVAAQREYAIASEGVASLVSKNAASDAQSGMEKLAEASLARLKHWDIGEAQLKQLTKNGAPATRRTLTLYAPANGIVIEKKAVQGMRFMPGEALYQIADLSTVWVIADVFERDLTQLRVGQNATLSIDAWPGQTFTARIAYIYPTLNAQTRTVPVRLELANPRGLLKPAMFANVEFATGNDQVLAVPTSAVIHDGTRQIVLVRLAQGRFAPREVKLGAQGDHQVEVLAGLAAGDEVVVTANFLIDAESNLRAAIAGFGNDTPATAPPSAHKEH